MRVSDGEGLIELTLLLKLKSNSSSIDGELSF